MKEKRSTGTTKRTKRWRVLVTPKEACESIGCVPADLLNSIEPHLTDGRVGDSERLAELLFDKDGVVLDLEAIDEEVLRASPRLRVISRFGEGCDAVDLEAARMHGVRVTRTRGVASSAVARHALALIFALTHHITENDRSLKQGLWMRRPNLPDGTEMVLGVLGFGKIGRALADLAAAAGCKVIVCSRGHLSADYERVKTIRELADVSQIISVHLPLTPTTRNMISKPVLKRLKGKYLVNTARGGIVDEEALLDSLKRHELAGYATDVFSREPASGVSKKVARHPDVIASPHIAAFDRATAAKMTVRSIENALFSLSGRHGRVNAYVREARRRNP